MNNDKYVMKIRPSWKSKGVSGGAIISLPTKLLRDFGVEVGDSLSVAIQDNKIILRKMKEET